MNGGRKSNVLQDEGIEAIRHAVEGLDVTSNVTNGALEDLGLQVEQNSKLLEALGSSVSDGLEHTRKTVARTELIVQDLEQSVTGKFTAVQTDIRSIESSSLVTSQAVTELLAKVDAFSEQMSGLVSYSLPADAMASMDASAAVLIRPFCL